VASPTSPPSAVTTRCSRTRTATSSTRAPTTSDAILEKGVATGKVADADAIASRKRLRGTGTIEDAADGADLVIEAVPERIELKVEIFAQLDRAAPKHAILASNTSSLSITEMAAATGRAPQVVGLHFFNPVHRMKLLEIVRALETSEATIAACEAVGARMGKDCVTVRESPGFVTSRINAMIGNEAFYMLQEGVASAEDIDKALKLGLNHPMGPFELVDLVGLDTRLSILRFLHRSLGEKFRPCPLIEQYVAAGRLGRKAGRGVYDYARGGDGRFVTRPSPAAIAAGRHRADAPGHEHTEPACAGPGHRTGTAWLARQGRSTGSGGRRRTRVTSVSRGRAPSPRAGPLEAAFRSVWRRSASRGSAHSSPRSQAHREAAREVLKRAVTNAWRAPARVKAAKKRTSPPARVPSGA
jgi:3-hydroxybutyryl-CoA dehydrogenase